MGAVSFLKPWSLYNSGETAGFDDETTAMLIASGVAVSKTDEEAPKNPTGKAAKAKAVATPPAVDDAG